ncbi:hypothetical protein JCM16106_02130 [Hydrogenophilus islandicus]
MPIYEYRCTSCGHEQEHLQKVNDEPIATCPACGSAAYVKLLSAAGFAFKGEGWYVTDYKGKGNSQKSAASASSETGGCGAGACEACAATTE